MRHALVIITLLLGLPGLALAAPARPPGWRDPYSPAPPARARAVAPRRPAASARSTPPAARAPVPATAPPTARPAPRPRRVAPAPPTPPRARGANLPPLADADPGPPTLHARHPVRPPRRWHLRLTAASHNLLVRHASLNAFKADDLFAQGGLVAGLEVTLARRWVVGADLGWVGGRFTGSVFATDTTVVEAHSLRVGARMSYRLWDAVTPYLRGGLAATWLVGRIRTDQQSMGSRSFAPGAYALAGVELTLRRQWMRNAFGSRAFTLGLVFEAGWVHLGRFDLGGGTDTSGLVDDYRAHLGRLTLQGATVNAGLVLAF